MKIIETKLSGVLMIEPDVFGDSRGFFLETYSHRKYREKNVNVEFVQDNLSFSGKGIVRGLHYQLRHPQAKLVQVLKGEALDVVVDIRTGSPQFGQFICERLSEDNKRQMFIPEGFAHGFCVTGDCALFHYKCSDYYEPSDEYGIIWSDPELCIPWPVENPVVSDKDKGYFVLSKIPVLNLPVFQE